MNTLFVYILESTICLSVLYVVYWFFLRRDTFFQLNRLFLLFMVIFSLLIPFLSFQWIPSNQSSAFMVLLDPVLITPAKMKHALSVHLQWIEIATVVYITGSLIFLLRFLLQLFQLYRITRKYGISQSHGQRVVFIDRGYSPFSFLNLVFMNESVIPEGSLPAILEHERVHIRQHHSLDMILVELATILQWFNPIIWLTGREIRSIHEYLADEGVLQDGINGSEYQQIILNETICIQVNDLANNFNVSLIKKRIAMMTKSKSGTWAKIKVLIALPALAALLFLLPSLSTSGSSGNTPDKSQTTPLLDKANNAVSTVAAELQGQHGQVKKSHGEKVYTRVEKEPQYPGGVDASIKFIVSNVKYPEEALKKNIQGTVFVSFIVQKNGAVKDAKVLRGIGGGCDEEALRVIKMMPRWIPGEDKGKKVAVQYVLPIKFKFDDEHKTQKKEEQKVGEHK